MLVIKWITFIKMSWTKQEFKKVLKVGNSLFVVTALHQPTFFTLHAMQSKFPQRGHSALTSPRIRLEFVFQIRFIYGTSGFQVFCAGSMQRPSFSTSQLSFGFTFATWYGSKYSLVLTYNQGQIKYALLPLDLLRHTCLMLWALCKIASICVQLRRSFLTPWNIQ